MKKVFLFLMIFFVMACAPAKKDLWSLRDEAAQAYTAGDLETAERGFKTLTERVPGDSDFWFRLGNVYARLHKPEDAVRAYSEALLRNPQNAKAWHNMGIVYLRQAANAFTQLLSRPDDGDALYQRTARLNDALLDLLDNIGTEKPAENTSEDR
jgi:cytochrome c-type biogenesis protein CcmH/NrfG